MGATVSRWISAFAALGALAATWLLQDRVRAISVGEYAFLPPPAQYLGLTVDPRIIRRLLGTRLVMADLIWIDTIIRADTLHEQEAFTSVYRAFKAVTVLDPDNIGAYYMAGLYLSVIKDDVKGATAILRAGARYLESHTQPSGSRGAWRIYFALGYNLIFEEHEVEEGGKWIMRAAKEPGAPALVIKLAERVSTERGRLDVAARLLNDLYRRANRAEERQRIQTRMLDVAARQELIELNEQFQTFLSSTKAYAFPKKRQLESFFRSTGHARNDMLGRPLTIDDRGRIAPINSR